MLFSSSTAPHNKSIKASLMKNVVSDKFTSEQVKCRRYYSIIMVLPWDHITPNFMTEESDDAEDDMTIVEHKLTWRSPRKFL